MTAIEAVAVACGMACVGLLIWRSVWSWPIGLVQVSLYVWIFWQARLYSDVILHVFYVALQIYGWAAWVRGNRVNASGEMPIFVLSPARLAIAIGVVVAGTLGLGFVMGRFTDAALPIPDAFTTVASLVAQVLLTRKVLQHWWFWIAVDVVAIPVYASRGLYLTSGLYVVFLVMAISGAVAWHRALRANRVAQRGAAVALASSSRPTEATPT